MRCWQILLCKIPDPDKYFISFCWILRCLQILNCMSKNKIYLWNIRFWRIFGFYILEILDTDKHKKNWIPDANQWLIFLCWNLRYWQVFEILFYRCVWDTDKYVKKIYLWNSKYEFKSLKFEVLTNMKFFHFWICRCGWMHAGDR